MDRVDGIGNRKKADGLLESFSQRLEDAVTSEPLTQAVTLNCGHSYNESTIVSLKKQDFSKHICPECRTPIQSYQPSYALRNLAESIARLPLPSEPKENSPVKEEAPLEEQKEAQAHFQRGRALYDQGLQEKSVEAILKALELNPNFEKALDFLDFITNPPKPPTLPQPSSRPEPSAPPDEEQSLEIQMEAQAHFQRGKTLFEKGLQEEAIAAVAKALELNPNLEKAQNYLAFITDPERNVKSLAVQPASFSAAKASAPPLKEQFSEVQREAQDCFQIGKTFYEQGLQAEAIAAVKIALELNPNFEQAVDYLAFITDPNRISKQPSRKVGIYEGPLNIEKKVSEEAVNAFNAIRPLLFIRELMNGKFRQEDFEAIKDFRISSETWCFTYTNPTKHVREAIDLWAIEEDATELSQVKAALQQLRNSWPACSTQDRKAYVAHSQRNQTGLRPLVKNLNDVPLQKISHNISYAIEKLLPTALAKISAQNPKQTAFIRDIFTRRLLFVEQFYTKWTSQIKATIQVKTEKLESSSLDPQLRRKLRCEIEEVQLLEQELRKLDIYAICKVLMAYPAFGISSYAEQVQLVGHIQNEVSRELLGLAEIEWKQQASLFEKFKDITSLGEKRTLSKCHAYYANEVALCAILNREDYRVYCTDKKLSMREEGLADLFIREAIRFAEMLPDDSGKYTPGTEYMAEGIQKSVFLKEMGDELKAELQCQLRDLGIIITHAIGTRDQAAKEYETPELEICTDPKQKKAVDERNASRIKNAVEILKQQVADHRARIREDLTIEDAKKDWPRR